MVLYPVRNAIVCVSEMVTEANMGSKNWGTEGKRGSKKWSRKEKRGPKHGGGNNKTFVRTRKLRHLMSRLFDL